MNGADFTGLIVICVIFVFGAVVGSSITNWQHEYVSGNNIAKLRMAENITSNTTIKEKIELIKTVCEDNAIRDSCYEEMYDVYIKPSIER